MATVTLRYNDGTNNSMTINNVSRNQPMPTLTTIPKREGYIFTGAYSSTSGGTKYYNADGTSANNWTSLIGGIIYAQWEEKWLKYNAYIYNGEQWQQATPYVYNGSNWQQIDSYIAK